MHIRRPVIDMTLVEFLVSNEQKIFHMPEVDKILDKATPFLRARNGVAAEPLFRQAVRLEPDKPDLLNNLATSLSLQDKTEEAMAIMEQLHRRFPDYLFARTALARAAAQQHDFERAEGLLEPLYARRKFHYSEWNSLCATTIGLLMIEGDLDSSQAWFDMWEDSNPNNPDLETYRHMLQS
jgi:tetratricopeptide (TPR) repeat protein